MMEDPQASDDPLRKLTDDISKLLAGRAPAVQGAIIADVLAIYLAGFDAPGNAAATRERREEVLGLLCETVWELVPINARIIGTTP